MNIRKGIGSQTITQTNVFYLIYSYQEYLTGTDMDFATLEVFVAVAESGSFSRAAERCFLTQSAVSKRIAALEDELQTPLFDRFGRRIGLTEAGDRFLISARRLLADYRASSEAVRSLGDEVAGRLKLATSHHVGIHRLPPVLREFVRRHPAVELDLVFMDSEQACAAVADGALELSVVTLPDSALPQLVTELVWPDPLVIVASPEHPLTRTRSRKSPEQLARHKAVLPGRGTVTRRILLNALEPHDVTPITSLETNYLETIKMLVSVGLGWSALPANMLDDSVSEVAMHGLSMQRELGSVVHRERTLSRAAEAFQSVLREMGKAR